MIKEEEIDYIFQKIEKLWHNVEKIKSTDLYVMCKNHRRLDISVDYFNNHYDFNKVGSNVTTLYSLAAELQSLNKQYRNR